MRNLILVSLATGAVACATTAPGTRPQDMNVAGHEAAAAQWTSANPTDTRQQEAALRAATAHRAAAQALLDAEANACKGIAPADRDISPFSHVQDIERAMPLHAKVSYGKNVYADGLAGATVRFRAVPGLTREWFQRIVDCHLARNAALGFVVPEMSDCPLVAKGARAVVRSAGAGFEVDVTSEEKGVPDEIWRRAQRLTTAG